MKHIAIIGTGIMGHGMAENYLKAGYPVTVWNRSEDKTKDLVALGATLAATPQAATASADIVFEVTANDASSREVWIGDDGILAGAASGQTLIASATLSVDWITELADYCGGRELSFFDMPLTGGRVAAETGQLTMLVGGEEAKLDALRPNLQAIAKDVKYFGVVGAGTKYKLILNTVQAIHIAAYGEAVRMAQAAGLDVEKVGEALSERPGGVVTGIARASYRHQPDPITFSVEWITKDLGYARAMADDVDSPLLDDVLARYAAALESGDANNDWTSINE